MAPTFRQLRYFAVLAEELHFGRAARRLNVSQPPLSTSVRQLEAALGVALVERSSRHVRLTRAGEVFAERARLLLSGLAEGEALARRVAESPGEVVRIGFVPSMIYRGLPEMLRLFRERHGEHAVELKEMNSAAQLEALAEGRIEVGFVHGSAFGPAVASLLILDEPFAACVTTGHPLARRRRVPLRALASEPLIIFSRALAPAYHDQIVALFRAARVEPRIAHEVNQWLTVVALVANGLGAALVPQSLVAAGVSGTAFVPLEGAGGRYESSCIWSSARTNPASEDFVACVRDVASRSGAAG